MRIEVAGSPEDENTLETYVFNLNTASFHATLVEAKRFFRNDEFAPWIESAAWIYPDIHKKSTMRQPEIPAWAYADARFFITQQIKFNE